MNRRREWRRRDRCCWTEHKLNHHHEPSEIAEETKSELGFTSSRTSKEEATKKLGCDVEV
ncbi:hypothetical protein Bca52824_026991 [Brassica carinata]|uniref:Uncharacterized protein n=1 Tax=Brassica carinata TaxID=52824 RepID=A0A8X7SJ28_BRACI|nr:hypothetical protein Bca52824_026991 [Brassica carinata]